MIRKSVFLSAVLMAGGLAAGVPAQADPPPWAPAHGYRAKQAREVHEVQEVREYKYVYYPEQQVYYAPASRSWFWVNGGNWQVSVSLPTQIHATIGSGIPVMLHSERPYVEHVYVEEHYGRPWREKHKSRHGNHGWDEHGHGHGRHD